MTLKGVHHAAIATHDMDLLTDFYTRVIGFQQHPEKSNWLHTGHGFSLHLMPSDRERAPYDPSRHIAFEVESLNECARYLLDQGQRPYQLSNEQKRVEVKSAEGPLDAGIGTLFLDDPEDNTIEFVERGRGILAEYDDGFA
ncbi:VOC family protein [Halomonas sp. HNIBRBA4712]|uniref:VOC family protein n=1 Tax=Halomonas sp. HNIBRBA4712 TaxID=3373087 RepID=UPI0037459D75